MFFLLSSDLLRERKWFVSFLCKEALNSANLLQKPSMCQTS